MELLHGSCVHIISLHERVFFRFRNDKDGMDQMKRLLPVLLIACMALGVAIVSGSGEPVGDQRMERETAGGALGSALEGLASKDREARIQKEKELLSLGPAHLPSLTQIHATLGQIIEKADAVVGDSIDTGPTDVMSPNSNKKRAKEAALFFRERGAYKYIALGLKSRALELGVVAISALDKMAGDLDRQEQKVELATDIVAILKAFPMPLVGSERATIDRAVRAKCIHLLAKLTGLDLPAEKFMTPQEVGSSVIKVEKWLKSRGKE